MTSPRRRKAGTITLTAAEAAGLTALLTTIDEFLRSSPAVTAGLAEFLRGRGSRFPGFEACNLIDELSFTALGYRSRLASGDSTDPEQETR
jgi:hypothetical protein